MNPSNLNESDYSEIVRSMVESENSLLNDRINWLVTIQGLLFAALGFAWDKQDTKGLVIIFSVLGFVVSLSAWSSLRLCNKARNELLKWWDKNKPSSYQGPDVIGLRCFGKYGDNILNPWRTLPFTFALGWLFVFLFNLNRV